MTKTTKIATAVTATLALPLAMSAVLPTTLVTAVALAIPFIAMGHLEGALAG
jgi:hypothetical protein